MPNLSDQLINLRKKLNLTQKQLGDKVGIDQTMISDYEMGKFIPSQRTINKFAKQGIVLELDTDRVAQVKGSQIEDYKENDMTDIAKEIIKIRENLGLNQSAFARKIGVSPTTLCEIESGKRHLTATTLKKIKDKAGISLNLNTPPINQSKEETKAIGKIKFTFVIANKTFELPYSNHVEEKATRTYTLLLNQDYFDFIKFLSIHYPSQVKNMKVDNVEKVLLLISHNTTNYFYTLQIKGDTFTGVVTFKPTNFEDIFDESMKEVEDTPLIPIPKLLQKEESNAERDILILCQNIIKIRDLLDETLELAEKVVQPIVDKEKEVVEVKKERQITEVIHKVYKQVFWGQDYIYIGTKTLNNGIIFRVAPELKESQEDWGLYEFGFICQIETYYDDGTVELGNREVFVPSIQIQEIESSDRKGVIGYVEHKAEIVEVIYYDRFVN